MKPIQSLIEKARKKFLCFIFGGVLLIIGTNAPIVIAADSAVIFLYHRFGEDAVPSTNITLEQFDAQLAEIKAGPYTVLPVPEIIARLKETTALPDRTIGITIDDAYNSFYREAWPRFKKAGLPVTIFVSTGSIGRHNYMTWHQIRELSKAGVTIGHHTTHHNHMPRQSAAKNAAEIRNAQTHFEKELGYAPTLFAYPYGEGSKALENLTKLSGFAAAFGQHSGVAHTSSNFFYLPRFSLSGNYGDLERFRLSANAVALPVTDITPIDSLIGDQNPPAIGFTLLPGYDVPKNLACYISQIGEAEVQRIADIRIEVRVKKSFIKGRTRLNCTARGKSNRWHWLGRQFFVR
jgi:peptidoglycan/xylan/chitin deacetylase (PgdA/CDA1 family)